MTQEYFKNGVDTLSYMLEITQVNLGDDIGSNYLEMTHNSFGNETKIVEDDTESSWR